MTKVFSVDIEVDNRGEILGGLKEGVERALEAIGAQVENYAKELCPVDTGNLRNSITHELDPSGEAVHIGSAVEYAAYQELGTFDHKQGYSPYLRPACEDHIDEYKQIAQEALEGYEE